MKASSYLEITDKTKFDKKTQAEIVKQMPGLPILYNSDPKNIIGKVVSAKTKGYKIIYDMEWNEKGIKMLEGIKPGLSHKKEIVLDCGDEKIFMSVMGGKLK